MLTPETTRLYNILLKSKTNHKPVPNEIIAANAMATLELLDYIHELEKRILELEKNDRSTGY